MNSDEAANRATDALNDSAAEIGERAVAILTESEILERIPVLKLGVAAARIVESIRGQALLKKLDAFVRGLNSVTREQRAEMISRPSEDQEYSETVGEYLIEYIDRLTGRRKALMSAAAFAEFARREIDRPMFYSLTHAVEVVLPNYLRSGRALTEEGPWFHAGPRLKDKDNPMRDRTYRPGVASLVALVAAGLVSSHGGFDGETYELTDVGRTFFEKLRLDLIPYRDVEGFLRGCLSGSGWWLRTIGGFSAASQPVSLRWPSADA
jgi:hypothetical protein